MDENSSRNEKYAVLIDSENVSEKYAKTIFDEIEKYGEAPERKIYGDWHKNSNWSQKTIIEYALTPIQQFQNTVKKNSTDIALVIDAMDILYKNKVDGFCIVTNDSDFTRLATRIREDGKTVIGMGVGNTANSLIKACSKFIYLNLVGEESEKEPATKKDLALTDFKAVKEAIVNIVNNSSAPVNVSVIGSRLGDKFSDFDTRNYGYAQLSKLIEKEFKGTLAIRTEGNRKFVTRDIKLNEDKLQASVIEFMKAHGGKIQNMSLINDELKKNDPDFDLHNYGYSRFSSYLRSINELTVDGSSVTLKK